MSLDLVTKKLDELESYIGFWYVKDVTLHAIDPDDLKALIKLARAAIATANDYDLKCEDVNGSLDKLRESLKELGDL